MMIIIVRKAGQTITLPGYFVDDISISKNYFLSADTGTIEYSDIFSGINIELIGVKINNRSESSASAILPRINFKLNVIKSIINRKIVIGKFYIENLNWRVSLEDQKQQLSGLGYKTILDSLNEDQRKLVNLFLGVNEGFLLLNSVINIDINKNENIKVNINLLEINNFDNKLKLNGIANFLYNNKYYKLAISNAEKPYIENSILEVKIGVDSFIPSDFQSLYSQLGSINTAFGADIILSFNTVGLDVSKINIFSLNSKTKFGLVSLIIDQNDDINSIFQVDTKEVDINIVRNFIPNYLTFLKGNGLIDLRAKFSIDNKLEIIESNIFAKLDGQFIFSDNGEDYFIAVDDKFVADLDKIKIDKLALMVNWNSINKQLSFNSIELDIGEGNISGSFSYDFFSKDIGISVSYEDMKIADITNLLPIKQFPNVYSWLKNNITSGISEGSFNFALNDEGRVFGGEFFAYDSSVHYLRPMPPLESLVAKGVISSKGIDLTILDGNIGEMKVEKNSKVSINFGIPFGSVDVDGNLTGNVEDIISLANSDPINFLSSRNIHFSNIAGQGLFNIKLTTPTKPNPQSEEIALKLDIDFNNLSYDQGPYSVPVRQGRLNFLLDKEEDFFKISGNATLGQSPSQIEWQQFGIDSLETYRIIELSLLVDSDTGKIITFDTSNNIEGKIDMTINWHTNKDGVSMGQAKIDMSQALIVDQTFNFIKVVGSKGLGMVNFSANNNSNHLLKITNSFFEFAGDKFEFNGLYDLGEKKILTFDLRGNHWGGVSNFNIYYNQEPSRVIKLSADQIPKKLLLNLIKVGAKTWQKQSRKSAFHVAADEQAEDLIVDVSVKNIFIDENKQLSKLKFTYTINGNNIDFVLGLKDRNGKDLFEIETAGDKKYILKISDLGVFFENINLDGVINGGKLVTNIEVDSQKNSFFGKYNIKDARLTNAPAIIKIFEAFSLAGISETFGKKGTAISDAEGEFMLHKSILSLAKGSIKTPTTDVTYAGEVDLEKEFINIEGTFSPLYQLNQLIGNIPIIKQLITDPKSSGSLFSIRYKLEGKFDDIKISSNPIYSIIPGILKRFERNDKKNITERSLSNEDKLKRIIEQLSNENANDYNNK